MKFLEKFNIKLKNKENLETSLSHTSYANEHSTMSYERLEFLGDAVLELITSKYLYENFSLKEGEMTKMRSNYVCEHALYEYAKVIGFIPYIKVGNGLIHKVNETIVADVYEAILGAIFLECGLDVCEKYVLKVMKPYIDKGVLFNKDYKSLLQEMVQTDKKSIEYILKDESGPSHDKSYKIEVQIDGIKYGVGTGHNKKEAEQKAAYDAYQKCVKRRIK